jgi:hypothetical protein
MIKFACALGVGVLTFSGAAEAAFVSYTPQNGSSVNFTTISESSIEPTSLGNALYNQPSAIGDALVFSELNFRAQSTGPQRDFDFVDFVDGQLNVTIEAKPLYFINDLTVAEFGDYTLQAGAITPGAAYASVTVPTIFVTILERSGAPIAPVQVNGSMVWSAPGREFFRNVPPNPNTTPTSGIFSGAGSIDLVSATGFNDITKIAFSFNNQLYAESLPNASAAIAKKGVTLDVGSQLIPEPATLGLVGFVAGALLLRRRHN